MLNRTNLTLSALSNRLNLSARSLVANTSLNTLGEQSLRIRHMRHDVMRGRMTWHVVSPVVSGDVDIPPIPGSMIPIQPLQHAKRAEWTLGQAGCGHCGEFESKQTTWFMTTSDFSTSLLDSRPVRPASPEARKRYSGWPGGRAASFDGSGSDYAAAMSAAAAGAASAATAAVAEA